MRLLDFDPTREYPGVIALSRTGRKRHSADLVKADRLPADHPSADRHPVNRPSVDQGRREFLIRCCRGASAALVPAGLRGLTFPLAYPFFGSRNSFSQEGRFHLHPHYRAQMPLDATLLKTQAGLDSLVTEKYQDEVAATLAEWSSSLLESPLDVKAVERVLTSDSLACSFQPVESRLVRSSAALEVRQNKFARLTAVGRDAFLQELRSGMSSFANRLR